VCKSLLPVLRSSARAESGWLDVVLAGDGDSAAYRGWRATMASPTCRWSCPKHWGVPLASKLPYAVLLDEEGRVASLGLINSREHLESLFEAKEHGVASIQDYLARRQKEA
jgi:methylamine dehydrogenase accessory protein MauD